MGEAKTETTWQQELIGNLSESDGGFLPLGDARVWAVKSNTDDMRAYYIIQFAPSGRTICTCKGFRFRDRCSHLDDHGFGNDDS